MEVSRNLSKRTIAAAYSAFSPAKSAERPRLVGVISEDITPSSAKASARVLAGRAKYSILRPKAV